MVSNQYFMAGADEFARSNFSKNTTSFTVILSFIATDMLNDTLADFYERDIRKIISEVNLFDSEEKLWKTHGSINNSSGNLVLHVVGGLNFLVGNILAGTGYVRDRDQEFIKKNVPRKVLVADLEALIPMIRSTLKDLTPDLMDREFPIFFDKPGTSTGYVVVQLLAHLNYHLGQINYLRRILN